jgi:melatonin receptor type 1B
MPEQEHTKILADELANRSLAQVIAETGILVLITLTALVGNSCVLYVFYKTPRLIRSITNYYIITLAISDVAFSLVAMPVTIAVAAFGRDVIGNAAGKTFGFIGFSLVYGSLLTTSLIAANRFLYIAKPFKYRKYFTRKSALLMIVGIWVISFSFNGAVYLSGEMTYVFYPGRFIYYPAFTNLTIERAMTFITSVTFAFIPLSMTTFCYLKIYRIVKGHNAKVSATPNAVDPARNSSTLSKDEISITMSVLALVCGFVFCWLPCVALIQLALYVDLPRHAEMSMTYMAYLASAINPIIFNIFNKPFRKQFLKLCCHS